MSTITQPDLFSPTPRVIKTRNHSEGQERKRNGQFAIDALRQEASDE